MATALQTLLEEHGHLLTFKERQVIELQARGLSQRQIALELDVSRSSVQSRFETGSRRLRRAVAESEAAVSEKVVLTEAQLETIRREATLNRREKRLLREAAERGEIYIPSWPPPEDPPRDWVRDFK